MSDILKETDEEELIPVEVEPKPVDPEVEGDDDEEGDEDKRLSEADDEDDNPNRKKRIKRRQVQKIAKENAQREIRMLREQNDLLTKRLSAVEINALNQNELAIDTRLADVQERIRQAEKIIAGAVASGSGDDVMAGMKLRDEAVAQEAQLKGVKDQVAKARANPTPAGPDPRVRSLAQEWMEANPWYDPKGTTVESEVTNAIDKRLVAEGYDPTSREYWMELTSRVSARLGSTGASEPAKRKAPPMGATREHAPTSTKREVYVSPERKAAMQEAGYWDDPALRNKMLKRYAEHDRNTKES